MIAASQRAANQARLDAMRRARREDVTWLAETGESLTGAARRLGLSADALEKWLTAHSLHAELNALRSREPIGLADRREAGRRSALARWSA